MAVRRYVLTTETRIELAQYLRTIGYKAWIEDTSGNEIDEKALKMAIRSRHEEASSS
jgi:hypothetical protein